MAELDLIGPCLGGVPARQLDHLGGHVDADDAALGAHPPGRQEGVEAAARAEVEHRLAGLEVEMADGGAAAEAEVGRAGHRGGLLRLIAEVGRRRAGVGGSRPTAAV